MLRQMSIKTERRTPFPCAFLNCCAVARVMGNAAYALTLDYGRAPSSLQALLHPLTSQRLCGTCVGEGVGVAVAVGVGVGVGVGVRANLGVSLGVRVSLGVV